VRISPRASRRALVAAAVLVTIVGAAALVQAAARDSGASAAPTAMRASGRPAPARVAFFGDSLAYEAKDAFAQALAHRVPAPPTIQTYPATALCDFRSSIAAELLAHRPDVLVLEFSGNALTACMRGDDGTQLTSGSAAWRARYLEDLRAVLALARTTGTSVVWVTAPPLSPDRFPTNYPRALAAAIRALGPAAGVRVVDTGRALTDDGRTFTRTLPCRPDEQTMCSAGRIVVRSDDGIHFDCHGTATPLAACVGYSAGARRFGEAIADAVG
jgi:hypothetical protein